MAQCGRESRALCRPRCCQLCSPAEGHRHTLVVPLEPRAAGGCSRRRAPRETVLTGRKRSDRHGCASTHLGERLFAGTPLLRAIAIVRGGPTTASPRRRPPPACSPTNTRWPHPPHPPRSPPVTPRTRPRHAHQRQPRRLSAAGRLRERPARHGQPLTPRRICRAFAARHAAVAVESVTLTECRTLFSAAHDSLCALTGAKKAPTRGWMASLRAFGRRSRPPRVDRAVARRVRPRPPRHERILLLAGVRRRGNATAGSICRAGCCVPSAHGLRLQNIDAERVAQPGDIEISVSHHQALTERQRGPRDERISGRQGLAVLVTGGLSSAAARACAPVVSTTVSHSRAPSTAVRSIGPLLNTSPW